MKGPAWYIDINTLWALPIHKHQSSLQLIQCLSFNNSVLVTTLRHNKQVISVQILCCILLRFLVYDLGLIYVLLTHVFITPTPDIMATISCAFNPPFHHRHWHSLQVIRPSNTRKEVNKRSCHVGTVVA